MAQIKTKQEILKIKKACEITDQIFFQLVKVIPKLKTEIEARNYLLAEIKKRKVIPSFSPIVTSGVNAGNEIHPKATDRELKGFVIVDFGVSYKGFLSDMTRTLYVGNPTFKEKRLYQKILDAQTIGIKNVSNGMKCFEADKAVRKFLGVYSKYFIHTLGHGVGTKIHEAPRIYQNHLKPYFRTNMVVTVEPGIYIKDKLGIRIEDTILVTKTKREVLTKSPKRLLVF